MIIIATTSIHSIGTDPAVCIAYVISDKSDERKERADNDIADFIRYAVSDKTGEYRFETLTSYYNCIENKAVDAFRDYRDMGLAHPKKRQQSQRKDGQEVVAWHIIQSFDGYEVDPVIANEIGYKLVEKMLPRYPSVISTHTNTDNIHNHIVFCAWNYDGGKHHNHNAFYRDLRKESDKLCREYGLSILDHTQNTNLLRWTDENGKTRFYEHTERKRRINEERNAMSEKTASINDYRNTPQYEDYREATDTNRAALKSYIDNLLPTVISYDDLLERLREIGFIIRDKKKNGDWLQHVSFKPPTAERAVRDDNIFGEEHERGFYSRENLTKLIENRIADYEFVNGGYHREEKITVGDLGDEYIDYTLYPHIDMDGISNEFKIFINNGGKYVKENRTDAERQVLSSIRVDHTIVKGVFNLEAIDRLILERDRAVREKRKYQPEDKNAAIVAQIQDSFRCLRFMEANRLLTLNHVNEKYEKAKGLYSRLISTHEQIESATRQMTAMLETPIRAAALQKTIDENAGNTEYEMEQLPRDNEKLAVYNNFMARNGLDNSYGVAAFKAKIQDAIEKENLGRSTINDLHGRIAEYENCINVLQRMENEDRAKSERANLSVNQFTDDSARAATQAVKKKSKDDDFDR